MLTTEAIIKAAVSKFGAPRGTKLVAAGGRVMRVHTPGERVLHLPNGAVVKVTTDDSGCATQVEEDDALHAIARPRAILANVRERPASNRRIYVISRRKPA